MSVDDRIREGITLIGDELPGVDTHEAYELITNEVTRRSRNRRIATVLAAGAAAAALAIAAYVTSGRLVERTVEPVGTPEGWEQATSWPGGDAWDPIPPGTYKMRLSRWDTNAPNAVWTIPDRGWRTYKGAAHSVGLDHVGVSVLEVQAVATSPCDPGRLDLRPAGHDARALVDALQALPGLEVTVSPETDDRFGYSATYLQVATLDSASCPDPDGNGPRPGPSHQLFDTANEGLVHLVGPLPVLDCWVVDVDGRAELVLTMTTNGVPNRLLRQRDAIVDSVAFAPSD